MFPSSIALPVCRYYGSKESHNYFKIELLPTFFSYPLPPATTTKSFMDFGLSPLKNEQRVKVEFLVGAVQGVPKGKISASSSYGTCTIIKMRKKWGGGQNIWG